MLFSIPVSGWGMIAAAATGFFMIGMWALPVGMDLPDDLRARIERVRRRPGPVFYVVIPVLAAMVLGVNLLRPEPAAPILFLYSVAFASFPVAVFPIRGRLLKAYITAEQNPDVPLEVDRASKIWFYGFLSAVILVATLALMTTPYGAQHSA
ncbi:hypothetical protein [Streptomyces sp. UNOC14_S4]|uniref:hypothetical protein n=1 Tax=Streptomyces sp. UNOC14_S4 TaxID=2872340 RepID=UPI001E490971|nr:hypothetical protein [Streptomyces sp. UNOC14_S4]MCC3769456.1 hypothetical protein [Streptomyces sp. UNOC14_S4]